MPPADRSVCARSRAASLEKLKPSRVFPEPRLMLMTPGDASSRGDLRTDVRRGDFSARLVKIFIGALLAGRQGFDGIGGLAVDRLALQFADAVRMRL